MDAQWVSAGAAIASVLVAVAAYRRSGSAERRANQAREAIGRVQESMSEHLGKIAEAQQALVQHKPAPSVSKGDRGRLSARLLRENRGEQLRVENTGGEPVEVVDVQVLEQPDVIVHGGGDPRGAQLYPGERVSMIIGLSMANTLPLKVLMRWRDSEGVEDRVQQVSFE